MHITINTLNLNVHDSADFLKELEHFVVGFGESAQPEAEEKAQEELSRVGCSTVDKEESAAERFLRLRSAVIEQVKDLDHAVAARILTGAINEIYAPRGISVVTTLRDSIFYADAT